MAEPVEKEEIPETSPHEFHEYDGRRWPVVFSYILVALAVAVVVVLVGRAIYRSAHSSSTKPQTPAPTQNIPVTKSTKSTKAGSVAAPSTPNQISNTGPGDVAAVFALSSVFAGGAHYALRRRRDA